MTGLTLERRGQVDETIHVGLASITPPINEDYWAYRVKLSDVQAVVAFPKFGTVGVGFAREEDWNTNLPYTCEAKEIFDHIAHNKGDDSVSDDAAIAAIRLIQDAIAADIGPRVSESAVEIVNRESKVFDPPVVRAVLQAALDAGVLQVPADPTNEEGDRGE